MIFFFLGGAVMLGVSIFIHELGHLVMGRLVGVKAEIFSLGYGKGIWKKKIGDTTWQITAFPIGGYVKFYGDDFQEASDVPGGFYTAPPLKRMIPVIGGPLFNLILGFFLFLLVHTISGPLAPIAYLWEELGNDSPAAKAGLQNGDLIKSIDGVPVKDFYGIKQAVAFSSGQPMDFEIERNGKTEHLKVTPRVDPGGISFVGLRPPGERYLEVNYPTDALWSSRLQTFLGGDPVGSGLKAYPYLNDGDVVLEVEGESPHSVYDLQRILGEHYGQVVRIKVRRQTMPWLTSWITEEQVVEVPSYGEYRINLTDLTDLKYDSTLPDQQLLSTVDEYLRSLGDMTFNGLPPGSFERMYNRYSSQTKNVAVNLDGKEYRATVHAERIGLLGFQARDWFQRTYLKSHDSFGEQLQAALEDTGSTVMLYPAFFSRLFSGRMSFMENTRGPVAMFAFAGAVFKSGIQDYLKLFGSISIALMVMNLLPFPVLDGGHLVFFAYEAVVGRPVSPGIMESIYRFGFLSLMILGIIILYRDILFVIGM